MSLPPYLLLLTGRLRDALAGWAEEHRRAAEAFLRSRQDAGGGFRGRLGGPDMYYTAFGLRALAVLGRLTPETARPAARFVDTCPAGDTIDLVSELFCRRLLGEWMGPVPAPVRDRSLRLLEQCRRDDGGYARAGGGGTSSTYQSFLALMAYELLGASVPDPDALGRFALTRRRPDGGFAELDRMGVGSTNPSAAAALLCVLTGRADEALLEGVAEFLLGLQRADGGWPAAANCPAGDLMSTFTALLTLADLGYLDAADTAAAAAFVRACGREGGFGALPDDPQADVEYTFYGLGCTAILGAGQDGAP